VYGGCKTNLSAVSNSQLIAAIFYLAAKNPTIRSSRIRSGCSRSPVWSQGQAVRMAFIKLSDFVDFVKDRPRSSACSPASPVRWRAAPRSALVAGIPG